MKEATAEKVERAAIPLRDYALFSKKLYADWDALPQFEFAYEHKGLLEIFQTEKVGEHAKHLVHQAHALGLTDTKLLNQQELFAMEPNHQINAIGAIHFGCDGHLYPNKLMQQLIAHLKNKGVVIKTNEAVLDFEKTAGKINAVITSDNKYKADAVVLATGSWSREMAKKLDMDLLLMPGRGYSITIEDTPYQTIYPSVLVEGRVALTPIEGNKMRFGGTMEIAPMNTGSALNYIQTAIQMMADPKRKKPLELAEKCRKTFRIVDNMPLPEHHRVRHQELLQQFNKLKEEKRYSR